MTQKTAPDTAQSLHASDKRPLSCDRADLRQWSDRGGPLPHALARHIRQCGKCRDQVRRISEVHSYLKLLQTQPMPRELHPRANDRALRMLRHASRRSQAAQRLLKMRPNLSPWQRVQLHVARLSFAAAAILLVAFARAGVCASADHTRQLGQRLADAHWQRHIDPDHEWLDPPNLA